jgi:hypothetical protein
MARDMQGIYPFVKNIKVKWENQKVMETWGPS